MKIKIAREPREPPPRALRALRAREPASTRAREPASRRCNSCHTCYRALILKKQGENRPQSDQTEEGLSLFFWIDRRRQAYLIRNRIFAYKTNTNLPKPSQANSIYWSHKCSSRTRIRTKNFDLHGTTHLFVEAPFYYKTQAKPSRNQAKPTSNQPPPWPPKCCSRTRIPYMKIDLKVITSKNTKPTQTNPNQLPNQPPNHETLHTLCIRELVGVRPLSYL